MKTAITVAGAILLLAATPAFGHRVDEYLQATTISLENGRVDAEIRLTPGIAVVPVVLRAIDTNADDVISDAEQRAYGESVLRDLSLTIDGARVGLRLVSWTFPDIELMKAGRGQILLGFAANVSSSSGHRRLLFENRHQKAIAAYLVNSLVPRDANIRVTAQLRDYDQSFYQLDFVQADESSRAASSSWWPARLEWIGGAALVLFAGLRSWRRRRRAMMSGDARLASSPTSQATTV